MSATQTKVTERPILFTAESIKAILEGTKTVTRRVMEPQPPANAIVARSTVSADVWHYCLPQDNPTGPSLADAKIVCPKGKPGDGLWVKEGWGVFDFDIGTVSIGYKARVPEGETLADTDGGLDVIHVDLATYRWAEKKINHDKWRTPIFMPRWASRINLEILSVGVERLQEITNSDAQAEGMPHAFPHRHGADGMAYEPSPGVTIPDPYAAKHNTGVNDCWLCMFRQGWNLLNAKRGFSWDSNPWVWRIEFKQV